MKNLLPGLKKFSDNVFPNQKPLFDELAGGQKPHTLFITCSDSRIDPSLVTQTQPGEIFVVRNAGNIVPPYGASDGGEEAAIEFAVDGLKVNNIVVCGHSQCGAMSALIDKSKVKTLPAVAKWLDHAESTLRRLDQNDLTPHAAIHENVITQVDNLKTHPSVSAAYAHERIRIFAWVYHFEKGQVTVYDPKTKSFVSSSEVNPEGSDPENDNFQRFAL